jgi:chromosome segregation ATPase
MTEKPNSSSRKVFSRNMKLFVVLTVALILAVAGITLVVWPEALSTIGALAGMAATAVFAWAWDKIKAEFKEFRERLKGAEEKADRAEIKAVEEGKRNTKIETTAVRAANTAEALASKVDVNAERSALLETRYEALSDMAYQLTENLQQERTESKAVTAELRQQLKEITQQNRDQQQEMDRLKVYYQREIAELKEQINRMGLDSAGDKAEITALRARVTELETRVAVLDAENAQLKDENRELRGNQRRMITDQLTGLSPDAENRLNHLEQERQKAKGELT